MSQQINHNKFEKERRMFLKQATAIGGIVSSSLLSTRLLAENYQDTWRRGAKTKLSCDQSELADDFVYLNSGTEGSMPSCVIDDFNKNLKRWASSPTASYETDKFFGKHQHFQREKLAEYFSVNKDNICITDNTTMGLSMVLMGINFKSADTVIFTNQEHTAITSPLTLQSQKQGLKLIERSFPAAAMLKSLTSEELIEHLFPNVEALRGATALCVSHVYPSTGIRLPLNLLREKVNELGIRYLIVDGAQAFGMINISSGDDDIKNCDFYACPGHKWLNGPPSTGILFLKNSKIQPPEFYPTLSQRMEKYAASRDSKASFFAMAEALQIRGCSNAPGFSAMLSAIEFQQSIGGFQAIEEHITKLSKQIKRFVYARSPQALVSSLSDPSLSSGLTVFFPFNWNKPSVVFKDKGMSEFIVRELLSKNIQIRSIGFNDVGEPGAKVFALRVSTATFNSSLQIEYFKRTLKSILSSM